MQEEFKSYLILEIHEDENTYWIMDRFTVLLEKQENDWKIKIKKIND